MRLTSYLDVREGLSDPALSRSVDPERFERGTVVEGVVLMLDGESHRARRGLAGSLFRRDMVTRAEREVFPPILRSALDRAASDGEADLVTTGALVAVVLSAKFAGVDLDVGSVRQREQLVGYVGAFAQASALDAVRADADRVRSEGNMALDAFTRTHLGPSRRRRAALLESVAAGHCPAGSLPRDLLTTLLRHQDAYGMDDAAVAREIAFYLEAGADTTAQALASSVDFLLDWLTRRPDDRADLCRDPLLVQRFVQEAVRLRPTVPRIQRRCRVDTTLAGRLLPAGTLVELDVHAANRDPAVFGPDAHEFNPHRALPSAQTRVGHSFGYGVHACVGRVLAIGPAVRLGVDPGADRLVGIVPTIVQEVLRRGVGRHPSLRTATDPTSTRWTRWSSYPVVLGGGQ